MTTKASRKTYEQLANDVWPACQEMATKLGMTIVRDYDDRPFFYLAEYMKRPRVLAPGHCFDELEAMING